MRACWSRGASNPICYAVFSRSVISNYLQPRGLQFARLLCPWGFSRKEYWSGLPCPPPGDPPNPGIEARSPHCRQILYYLSHQGSPIQHDWCPYKKAKWRRRHSQREDEVKAREKRTAIWQQTGAMHLHTKEYQWSLQTTEARSG